MPALQKQVSNSIGDSGVLYAALMRFPLCSRVQASSSSVPVVQVGGACLCSCHTWGIGNCFSDDWIHDVYANMELLPDTYPLRRACFGQCIHGLRVVDESFYYDRDTMQCRTLSY